MSWLPQVRKWSGEKFFKVMAVATLYVQSLQDSVLYFITGFNIHVNISYVNDFS